MKRLLATFIYKTFQAIEFSIVFCYYAFILGGCLFLLAVLLWKAFRVLRNFPNKKEVTEFLHYFFLAFTVIGIPSIALWFLYQWADKWRLK